MIDQWYLIFFNLMFSAFPQLITGTLDKDVSAETLQQLPHLYVNGQNSEVSCYFLFVSFVNVPFKVMTVNVCLAGIQAIYVLDEHDRCLLPKSGLLFHPILCESLFDLNLMFACRFQTYLLCSSRPYPLQAYADSDVDLFTWGTPITTLALFTILVHLGIETKTWVKKFFMFHYQPFDIHGHMWSHLFGFLCQDLLIILYSLPSEHHTIRKWM